VVVTAVALCGVLSEGVAWAAAPPASTAASVKTPAKAAPVKAATASSAATAAKKAPARSYVVKNGDGGWFQLAHAHHTTMAHLLAANHASAGTPVKAGQAIKLPGDAKDPPKAKAKTASTNVPPAKRAH
jgi:hypothetical protein